MSDSPVVQLSHFRAHLAQSLSRRGKALLVAPDMPERVKALEPLEAYFIIKEIGVDDALALLRHVTPEQLQAFVDIDCWDGALPDRDELDAWLAPFASDGSEVLAQAFCSLDHELQTWFLTDSMRVYVTHRDDDADIAELVPEQQEDVPRMNTPDGFFILDAPGADRREVHPFVLTKALYERDMNDAFRAFTAARWELQSGLEEEAFRVRNGRLEDLGFPPREEAFAIFSKPPDRPPGGAMQHAVIPTTLPALYAEPLTQQSLLGRGLARVANQRLLQTIESDLAYLISTAIVAYGDTPQDVAGVTHIAARIRDTVSLGIETLISPERPMSHPDGEQAAAEAAGLLRMWPVRHLFQHGYHRAFKLRRSAAALAQDPVVKHWLETIETEQDDYSDDRMDREMFRALLAERPMFGGYDTLQPLERRAFATQRELADVEARLDALAKRLI